MKRVSEEKQIPLFSTPLKSKEFTAEATLAIEEHLAPKTSHAWNHDGHQGYWYYPYW